MEDPMRLTLTLTVTAIGTFLFGLAYLLFPERLLLLYGITLDPSAQWTARYLGATLLGLAAINWLGRTIQSGSGLRAILVGTFIAALIGFIVSIMELLNGSGSPMIWTTVIIYFLLTLGYGDFIFRTPPPS